MTVGYSGQQPGDPARAALAMIRITESEEKAPRHLVLGAFGVDAVTKRLQATLADIEKWRGTSIGADFPAAAQDPKPDAGAFVVSRLRLHKPVLSYVERMRHSRASGSARLKGGARLRPQAPRHSSRQDREYLLPGFHVPAADLPSLG
ncbi:conserved hypothetical protein [Ricinus communis]|uniref:Uncharacterized protein n=1 Tax=Ricinus communis TaxID=3988 RepID=B9TMF7_RICCO|nr:conserved hypothetical protein [Ricinus communis]